MNLRPPGPQPGALPDCATPRGVSDSTDKAAARIQPPAAVGTYVRVRHLRPDKSLRPLRATQAAIGLRLAPKGSRATRQLLPDMWGGIQTRALRSASRPAHRERPPAQASYRRRARRAPHSVLPRAAVRGLRRDRSARPGVRPHRAQALQHRAGRPRPQLAVRAGRDRHVRRRLCKLSSSTNRLPGWVRTRGGSSTVEPRPSKAMMRVRFPSAASTPSAASAVRRAIRSSA